MARSLIRLKEKNTNIFDKKVEWIPVPMTLRGGLVTDINCMSNVQGLFAAGTAHSTGRGLFTGWSAGKCLWTGSTASTFAAKYIECSESERLDLDRIVHLKDRLYSREIHADTGEKTLNEITRMLQRIIFSFETSILKSEDRLKRALKEVDSIKENELPKAKIPNLHEFIKFRELGNMFLAADLYLRASLLRKESRGDHKREDYPDPYNKAWLKWIVLNKDLKEGHRLRKMPWEQYRYQPVDIDG